MPITEPYLTSLKTRLIERGFPNEPLIMLSSGGIIGAELAGRFPVRMIESGPAAGALVASYLADELGSISSCPSTWAAPQPKRASSRTVARSSQDRSKWIGAIDSNPEAAFP